ncbi:hypothetical protein FACS189425_06600 [Clostridia bacterium]|nr:hypothetical protein FACS189425_06600 [Clostridia bacterium]
MDRALKETSRRRKVQIAHNEKYGITPTTIIKTVHEVIEATKAEVQPRGGLRTQTPEEMLHRIEKLTNEMQIAAFDLQFERAAELRDEIKKLELKLTKKKEEVMA